MKPTTDQTEFMLHFSRLRQPLFNYVLKMIRERQETEDIVQSTFLRLFENLPLIRNREGITRWVFSTARNDVYQHFRNRRTHVDRFNVSDVDELEVASPEDPALLAESLNIKELVKNALEELPIEQRDVFLLREYGCLSYREIAEMQSTDEELVKSRLHKARQKLISRLKKVLN